MAKTTIPAGYFAAGSIATADLADDAITAAKIDSTATGMTFADLTVDTSTLKVDASNNRVGIGTTSPSHPLHISSTGHTQYQQHRQSSGVGVGQEMKFAFNTADGTEEVYSSLYTEISANTNGAETGVVELRVADAGSLGKVIKGIGGGDTTLYADGDAVMTLQDGGKVGIGTTSPTHGLTVSDEAVDASASRRVTIKGTNHGANAGYRFTLEDSGGNTRSGGYYFQPGTSDDASYLSLSADDSAAHLNVLGSGDVGVGTTTPFGTTSNRTCLTVNGTNDVSLNIGQGGTQRGYFYCSSSFARISSYGTISLELGTNDTKRLELTSAGHLVPAANNTYDLGSATLGFRNIYTNDLNLSNMAPAGTDSEGNAYTRAGNDVDGTNGSWTIQEGADDLFIINRINGKKYRFNLTEVTD